MLLYLKKSLLIESLVKHIFFFSHLGKDYANRHREKKKRERDQSDPFSADGPDQPKKKGALRC